MADFESFLVDCEEQSGAKTTKLKEHVAAAYAFKVVVDPEYQHLECFKELVEMDVQMKVRIIAIAKILYGTTPRQIVGNR